MSRKLINKKLQADRVNALDVRTNILLLLVINTLVMTGKGGIFQLTCAAVVCVLLLLQRHLKASVILAFCISTLGLFMIIISLAEPSSGVMALLAALMYIKPYLIAGFMGYYFICSTPPNMLIAGMNRLKVPKAVTIPLAVMLRFFPVICEEQQAIRGAMRMRGLPGKGGFLLHPLKTVEYILIPLISVTLRSGEALSSSALSRGLGNPISSSSILSLKFRLQDGLMLLACIGLTALFFYCGES